MLARPKKNRYLILFLLFSIFFLTGCNYISFSFNWPPTSQISTTSRTTTSFTFEGSIPFDDSDVVNFAAYVNPDIQNLSLEEYNELLVQTRDHIRRTNIKIIAVQYRYVPIFPGSRTTIEQVVGSSAGSGVIYKEDSLYYYALTNYHVIDNGGNLARYEVKTFGSDKVSHAEVMASNESLDLAVVRFEKTDHTNVEMIDFTTRAFTKIEPGELVLASGNPQSIDFNVTFGTFIRYELIQNAEFKVLYHSAMIHQGSSGGALVDIEGHLLGINTWGSSSSDEQSFAVPIHIVLAFLISVELN